MTGYLAAIPILRQAGDANFLSLNLTNLALARIQLGEQHGVCTLLDEGLALAHGQGDRRTIALNLAIRALLILIERQAPRAAHLIGAIEAMLEMAGLPIPPAEPTDYVQLVARIRAALGSADYATAHAEGKRWSVAEASAYALADTDGVTVPGSAPSPSPFAALSRREHEVLPLLAQGLGNKAIADQLHVGQRTIETHVSNIIGKLGLQNRIQVVAWLAAQEKPPH